MEKVANRQASADSKDLKKPKNYLLEKLHDLKTATIFTTLLALVTPAFVPNTEARDLFRGIGPYKTEQEMKEIKIDITETKKDILDIIEKRITSFKKILLIPGVHTTDHGRMVLEIRLDKGSNNGDMIEVGYTENKVPSFIIVNDKRYGLNLIDKNLDGKIDRIILSFKNVPDEGEWSNYRYIFETMDNIATEAAMDMGLTPYKNLMKVIEIKYEKNGPELYGVDFVTCKSQRLVGPGAKKIVDLVQDQFAKSIAIEKVGGEIK